MSSHVGWQSEEIVMIQQNMINCPREKYQQALAEAGTRAKPYAGNLQAAAKGLFNYVEHGRQIAPATWMRVLRAHMRGNIAISRLMRKHRWTAKGMRGALAEQGRVLDALFASCPEFFAGLIVPAEEREQKRAAE